MYRIRSLFTPLSFMVLAGCSCPINPATEAGDPKAVELFESHADALLRGDWRAAHAGLHPDLKTLLPLNRFTEFHARRRKSDNSPRAVLVAGSERSGDDVLVSFDALFAPTGGGEPVSVPPRRRVRLRRSGETWALMTHDVFAVETRHEF